MKFGHSVTLIDSKEDVGTDVEYVLLLHTLKI